MAILTTLKKLDFEDARAAVAGGAAFIDLRPTRDYLQSHIPGSIALLYEAGPGLPSRARDCLPLDLSFVLMDGPRVDYANAAAALRGKGFSVLGVVEDALARWRSAGGSLATTEVLHAPPNPDVTLDVGDPGATAPSGAMSIPVESLWSRLDELEGVERIVVAAGYGVRAAIAVGLLERAGVKQVQLWHATASD